MKRITSLLLIFLAYWIGMMICAPLCQAQTISLQEPVLKTGKAVFKCRFHDYDPTKISRFLIVWKDMVGGKTVPSYQTIDKDGYVEVAIDLIAPTQVEINSDFLGGYILLNPGEESALDVNMKDVIAHRATLKEGEPESMDYFIFSGANADLNRQLASDEVAEFLYKDWKNIIDLVSGFLGMSLEEYKNFHIQEGADKLVRLDSLKEAMNLSDQLYEMTRLRVQYQVLDYLMQPDVYLASAIKIAQNEGKETDYVVPQIDIDYYSFLKDYPVNNKVSLYAPEYGDILAKIQFVLFQLSENGQVVFKEHLFLEHLAQSGNLLPEDVRWVNELKKQNILSWDKKQVNDYKKSSTDQLKALIDSKKLTEKQVQQAQELMGQLKQVKKVEDIADVEIPLMNFQEGLISDFIVTREFLGDIIKAHTPTSIFPQIDEETFSAFYERYADQRERFVSHWMAAENDKLLSQILGTDQGFLFDLLYMQRLIEQMDKGILLDEKDAEKLAGMNPVYWEYVTKHKKEDDPIRMQY